MPKLTISQETIDRAYELRESGTSINMSNYCPMGLEMAKFLGLEEGDYGWGYYEGDKNYTSTNAYELVVEIFDKSVLHGGEKLVAPITVDIEEGG